MKKKARKKKGVIPKHFDLNNLPELIIKNPFEDSIIRKKFSWSVSSLKLFRKCKRKFFWKTLLRLSPKAVATPLKISNTFHTGLAEWYKAKRASMKKIAARIAAEALKEVETYAEYYDQEDYDKVTSLLATLTGMLTGYAHIYKGDKEKWKFTKEDVECWFSVDMGSFIFKGKLDLLPCSSAGKQLLVEHKAVKNIHESNIERLPLDTQMRGYIFGADAGLNRKPKQVIYDLVKKCSLRKKSNETIEEFNERIAEDYKERPDFYFRREKLRFSTQDINAFVNDLYRTHWEFTSLVNNLADPLDPRNWICSDHICDEFFRTCPYLPLCLQGLDRGTAKLYYQYNEGEIMESK